MITLRSVADFDLRLIFEWRNNPLVYEGFYQQNKPLEWGEHRNWLASRNKDWRILMVCMDYSFHIGVVTIGQLDHWCPEIGLYLGETSLWGRGYGTCALRLAIKWLQGYAETHRHIVGIHSTILNKNKASIAIFTKCEFKRLGVARKDESWYNRTLEDKDGTIRKGCQGEGTK